MKFLDDIWSTLSVESIEPSSVTIGEHAEFIRFSEVYDYFTDGGIQIKTHRFLFLKIHMN